MNNKYNPTIGLEIHAELKTRTKMFCDSKNDPDETRPNVNVCPICMGHPGTLPVINKEAVKRVLGVGVALGGKIADFTEFDRKNYFYPDIPKGYQLSQYKYPLVSGGSLSGTAVTRVHLEEDTAKSTHDTGEFSLIDFNRAGVPLMELVTEPVIGSAEQAGDFARELQLLLRCLGASDANMEKGEMRVEANVSVRPESEVGSQKLGTKVEVKNLNSFKAVEKAIAYEVARHIEMLERGETVLQETRGWDEAKQKTFSQRLKEESHDYRYFPDPDLPKLLLRELPEFAVERLKEEMPELPWQKRRRYLQDLKIKERDAEVLVSNLQLAEFFEAAAKRLSFDKDSVTLAVNYLVSDIVGLIRKDESVTQNQINVPATLTAGNFAELMKMIKSGALSSRGAKDIIALMYERGGDPKTIAEQNSLVQKSDMTEISRMAESVIKDNEKAVSEYKSGKEASLQFLVGQGMKKSKGSANPEVLGSILKDFLS